MAQYPAPLEEPIRLLVLDDDASFLRLFRRLLPAERFRVSLSESPHKALQLLKSEEIEVALVDLVMPELDGLRFMSKAKSIDPDLEVVIVTGQAEVERAVEAIRRGAYDFITKPIPSVDSIELTMLRAAERRRLSRRVRSLEGEREEMSAPSLVGESRAVRRLMDLVNAVAGSAATVLICGESGTGKELIANAIHRASPRRQMPFLTVNCSALADTLLEAELFGHVRGAFTGAEARRVGIFEAADGGTVFLDEIAEMSMACQAKVLRTLQEGEVRPVGAATPKKVDVRVVAATNVDLEQHCREGKFRKDLFYRLNVIRIDVPPLRERGDDIALLASYFLTKFQDETGKKLSGIKASTLERLARYEWPGNVRELKNMMERAVLLAQSGQKLSTRDFPALAESAGAEQEALHPLDLEEPPTLEELAATVEELPFAEAKARAIEQFERRYVTQMLERHGSIAAAAAAARLDRSNFKRLMRRHNLLPKTQADLSK